MKGVSTSIVSKLFTFLETSLNISSSHHPQTDGHTERFNCMLNKYLCHFVDARQKHWVQLLDVAQFCFNAQTSSSTGKSPFEIVSRRQALLSKIVGHPYAGKNPQAHSFAEDWKQTTDITQAYLEKASKHMKKWYDKKQCPLKFQVGDQVLIKLNVEQIWFRGCKDQRLVRKYDGSVEVHKRIRNASYKVALRAWMKIHLVIK